MTTNVTTADSVAGLFQNLQVDQQANIRDTSEVQPSQNSETQESGLDPSISTAADTSNVPAGYGGIDSGMYYTLNGYPTHHGYFVGGYDYPVDWDDYSRQMGPEGGDSQNPQGGFSDNGALVYHPSGYAYTAQHLYASYAAGAPIRGDSHLYGAHGYPYAGHLYQQSVPSNTPFLPTSTVEASTGNARESTSDQSSNSAATGNSGQSGTRPSFVGYPSGLHGRGVLPAVNSRTSVAQDARPGYEGNRVATTGWSDLSKTNDVQQRQNTISMGHNVRPLAPLIPHISPNQHRPRIGIAPTTGGFGRVYQPAARMYSGSSDPRRLGIAAGWEPRGNGRNWYALEKEKPWGRGNGMLNNGNPSWDILNEQNRGPRTTRGRYQRSNSGSVRYIRAQGGVSGSAETINLPNKDQYNSSDFVCTYEKAKFFIIKSYSEDDIHMSIKYNVWASTANGNKKLDAAFQEGQSLAGKYPVFLFFSVNASGQFCGVAEMVGPVDFNKTMDFWQQDKWTGKVPLKWHIIKDVPNSQFRHIILENNDNKPVTNSRDTQEVPLNQGLEMLNIFKNFNMKTSILDDFQYYETRQKLIQDKRTKQQAYLQHQQNVQRVNKDSDQRAPQDDASRNVHDIEVSNKNGTTQKSTEGVDNSKTKTTNMSQSSASSKEPTLLQAVAEISLVSKSSQK